MVKPRVIIADIDANYIVPLQLKFVNDFFDKINLEIITDKEYFNNLFMVPNSAEILIVSEEFYDSSLQRHNIANIFLMTEEHEEGETEELNVVRLFKYTSIKEIFNKIIGRCANVLNIESNDKKETQIILVTSASGGVGKTTVAMGLSTTLTKNYRKVLYINASRLQSFQCMLENESPIISSEVYRKLTNPDEQIYEEIKHVIRKEIFSYLPPFKASLISLGLKYSLYEQIAIAAKKSAEYDFIVIDTESTFDYDKTRLLDLADKVIIVTEQTDSTVYATNMLVSNIDGINSDKYIFVCNKFNKDDYNAIISPQNIIKFSVDQYIEQFTLKNGISREQLFNEVAIRKISFLVG